MRPIKAKPETVSVTAASAENCSTIKSAPVAATPFVRFRLLRTHFSIHIIIYLITLYRVAIFFSEQFTEKIHQVITKYTKL
jgi:abortive infection bacteriophage resistance protein